MTLEYPEKSKPESAKAVELAEVDAATDARDAPAVEHLAVHVPREVDLERRVDRDEAGEPPQGDRRVRAG